MLWEQGRTEVKVVRCRLMLEAFLPLRAIMISSLGLLPRAISGSHKCTTARVCGQQMAQGCHWWPSRCLRGILPPESCWSRWPVLPYRAIVCSMPELLLRALYGFIALWQPGSELTSVVPVATEGCVVWFATWNHIGTHGPCCIWTIQL